MAVGGMLETEGGARARSLSPWPEVVIFDCDGVLVDSEAISLSRLRAALSRLGLELGETQARDLFVGVSAQSMGAIAERALGAPLPAGFHSDLARDLIESFERELKGMDGIGEAVAALDARVCVASSSSPERIRASLRIVGYAELFGPNVFSAAEVARGKPAPDLFLHAARRMGVDARACVVVEDSVPGVAAAHSAEMVALGFTGGAHAKGDAYRAGLFAAGARIVFDDMRALPRLIAEIAGGRRGG
jgi:HAD superfamily hydrolase (TIGR01509 family)